MVAEGVATDGPQAGVVQHQAPRNQDAAVTAPGAEASTDGLTQEGYVLVSAEHARVDDAETAFAAQELSPQAGEGVASVEVQRDEGSTTARTPLAEVTVNASPVPVPDESTVDDRPTTVATTVPQEATENEVASTPLTNSPVEGPTISHTPVALASSYTPYVRRQPQLRTRLVPVEDEWREKLTSLLDESKPGTTPPGVIKDLSSATSISLTEDETAIEIKAYDWQHLKEAEALLRLLFRDYNGSGCWWFFTIPAFVSTIITGTTGTHVPAFSDLKRQLVVSIAPYDENSTRRAFFITGPDFEEVQATYRKIRRGWDFWKYRGLHQQINAFVGILYGVRIHEIKADGSCLFRALALAVLGDEERHMETRKAIVDFMRSSDELKSFIIPEDESEDTAAYVERYLVEMEKPGTWGDQVEITAFTRVYKRSVRVFSYNSFESRLVHVETPALDEDNDDLVTTEQTHNSTDGNSHEGAYAATGGNDGMPESPQGSTASDAALEGPGKNVWLLHMHGHYSLLAPGPAPPDEQWQRLRRTGMLAEDRVDVHSSRDGHRHHLVRDDTEDDDAQRLTGEDNDEETDGVVARTTSMEVVGEEGDDRQRRNDTSSVSGNDDDDDPHRRLDDDLEDPDHELLHRMDSHRLD